jgi:F0F1-type ATP synthase delta subunit
MIFLETNSSLGFCAFQKYIVDDVYNFLTKSMNPPPPQKKLAMVLEHEKVLRENKIKLLSNTTYKIW